jgi:hypothetical protein
MGLYCAVCLIPVAGGTLIEQNCIFSEPSEMKAFRSYASSLPLHQRFFSYPARGNYQVQMKIPHGSGAVFSGLDPILYNTPHPFFYEDGLRYSVLHIAMEDKNFKNLFSLYPVRYILYNESIRLFDFTPQGRGIDEYRRILDNEFIAIRRFGFLTLYQNKNFVPYFYVPKKIQRLDAESDEASVYNAALDDRYEIGTAFAKSWEYNDIKKRPVIEYKKINAAKYRLRIHSVEDDFPLIFQENFSKYWRAYIVRCDRHKKKIDLESCCGRCKGNEYESSDRAEAKEVDEFKKIGIISTKDVVNLKGFISKLFCGTIENNNLPEGNRYETFLMSYIPSEKHFLANSYANGWIISHKDILGKTKPWISNENNGSYDIELIIEYGPERYINLFKIIELILVGVGIFVIVRKIRIDSVHKKL